MSFLSITWVVWIWLTAGLYWLAPRESRSYVLMGLSLAFMLIADPFSALMLVAAWALTVIGVSYRTPTQPILLGLGAILVLVLAGFKVESLATPEDFMQDVAIPLGLSYYTFRCLHVMIERFKGNIPAVSPKDLASYLFFVPTFVIGPIHRINTFLRDQKRQRFDLDVAISGAERILLGYVKIVVLSNFLVEFALGELITDLQGVLPALAAYLKIAQAGLNIYLQFSGHSDVAIGFAAILGFKIIENFDRPFLKPNISAFWRSWHISLSQWCREYIYAPVVAKTRSPALGALGTMIIIGLWHEISLRYLLWGAYHGLGLIVWQRVQDGRNPNVESAGPLRRRAAHVFNVILTVNFVWFSFVILTTPDLRDVPANMLAVFGIGV